MSGSRQLIMVFLDAHHIFLNWVAMASSAEPNYEFERGETAPTNEFLVVEKVARVGAEPLQQELIERHQSLGVVRDLSRVS